LLFDVKERRVISDVLTVVKVSVLVIWILMFHRNILSPSSGLDSMFSLKYWYLTSPHAVTTLKTNIDTREELCV
jgi:hypothetical protein